MHKQGHFLREWRKHKGYTLEHVAERAGMSHQNLGKIERGRVPYNQTLLESLAEIYGTDPGSLVMRNPLLKEDHLGSIWNTLQPSEQRQAIEIIKTIQRTGTDQ